MKSPDRHNYLLPVDFEIDLADDITIKRKVVSAEEVRDRLKVAGATVTLVFSMPAEMALAREKAAAKAWHGWKVAKVC